MAEEVAIDTTVLRRANVPLTQDRASKGAMSRRVRLLERIRRRDFVVLMSQRLADEYLDQISERNNDYIVGFFELMLNKQFVINWEGRWAGGKRALARRCRFPPEDDHVLRTAIRPHRTTIYTEERRMLDADGCIYREFRVHISEP